MFCCAVSVPVFALQGKKPFFLSKAGKRELAMTDKFKELEAKGPGALDKFMQKRRKKKASKDKRALPWQSRSQPPA